MGELRSEMHTALCLRNYSPITIKTYLFACDKFAAYFNRSPRYLGETEIKEYFKYLVEEKQVSCSMQRQTRAALRFLYTHVLGQEKLVKHIPIARRRIKPFPQYISPEEVRIFLKAVKDPKHLMMLEVLYATGVRTQELISLKVSDIDSKRNVILVRNGKGSKTRHTLLSKKLLKKLRKYWLEYRPNEWLFEGKQGHCSQAVPQKACQRASKECGLGLVVTPRTLRHSFATTLHEHGESLITISKLLGHQYVATTEVYTHVTPKKLQKTKSPFEYLK